MFQSLVPQPPDKILQIGADYAADPRPRKLDLGVGVYKDDAGNTAILKTVKQAELRLVEGQQSKGYVGLAGDRAFNQLTADLVFGRSVPTKRVAALQVPGGSGALRMMLELASIANPGLTVWVPSPTWANHLPIIGAVGINHRAYGYFDFSTCKVDFAAMCDDLKTAGPNDLVLLHGCCHNPTGADLDPEQWQIIAKMASDQGFVPFIDIAYQGFGDGLDQDAAGLRVLAGQVPEMLVASSCSKNFALYRERTGCAMVLAPDQSRANVAMANMMGLARTSYSMPPDHGAAIVRTILADPVLAQEWRDELAAMRERMLDLRNKLAAGFRARSNSARFDFVAHHRGMFSLLGLSAQQVARLRDDHAIYMVGDSRINIAGLREDRIDDLVDAVMAVL